MASRILVIEDNPVNLELMCCLLQAWQHEVLVARNGGEYTWEVLVDTLPEGIKATVTGDRIEVKGTSTLDTGGTLKVRVTSGGESSEYELKLRASGRD